VGSKDDVVVSFQVTNTGEREGTEVPQLYLRQEVGSVETPVRSLEGFTRVHLRAHEMKIVTMHLHQKQLEVWNAEKAWAVEPGYYTLWVGGSSEATLTTRFLLKP
jgi:beta-glucosidase